jgi:uncharacterized protein
MPDVPFNHSGYLQHLAEGRLAAVRCQACQALLFPPRSLCPNCYASQMEWLPLSGRGTLLAYTLIYIGLPAMAAAGYDRQNPYISGVVRLAEGPAISALIISPETEPAVGMPMRAVFGLPAGLAFTPESGTGLSSPEEAGDG